MLSAPQSDLWNAYLDTENHGLRSERNDALDRFLGSFAELSPSAQHDWALSLASQIVDGGSPITVRMPLFRRVLLPALQSAIAQRVPGTARWLAGFAKHLYKCSDLRPQLINGTLTEQSLLETALEHDPDDDVSRRKLHDLLISRLNYTLHELPAGILYGHDGATVDQCREMLKELADFTQHANRLGVIDDSADLIANCQFHYKTYAEYLTDHRGTSSYAEYLSSLTDT